MAITEGKLTDMINDIETRSGVYWMFLAPKKALRELKRMLRIVQERRW